ncbi:MAG: CAP domain-containing protein [Chloroflexota bacterium]|nr:CAP domain-containing protein [Dehalococcoidia bacterium]MDW8253164.1 CAP domain-containing protein [Chloroflexota bacterium]
MTLVDLQLLIPLSLGALTGLRRGFLLGLCDLLGLAGSVWLAALLFAPLAALAAAPLGQPAWVVNLLTFGALVISFQLGYGLILLPWLARVRRLVTSTFFLTWLDIAAGVIPGAVKGLLLVAIVLIALGIWPIFPPARAAIEASQAGKLVLPWVRQVEPWAAGLVSRLGIPAPVGVTDGALPLLFPARATIDPQAEEELLALVNAERQKHALAPLIPDARLRDLARAYAQTLYAAGLLSHTGPDGSTPAERLQRAGVRVGTSGENLAFAPTARSAHEVLMASPSHRANILSPRYRRAGFGVAAGPSGILVVQQFTD